MNKIEQYYKLNEVKPDYQKTYIPLLKPGFKKIKYNEYELEYIYNEEFDIYIPFQNIKNDNKKYKQITGKMEESLPNIDLPHIYNLIKEPQKPIIKLSDITNSIPYTRINGIIKTNSHIGQRKLLLNEIQFHNIYVGSDTPQIVMYIGSASCEHLPIMLELFPNTKYILIDPNFHLFDCSLSSLDKNDKNDKNNKKTYTYIYKNITDKSNLKYYKSILKNNDSRSQHLIPLIKNHMKVNTVYNDEQNALNDNKFGYNEMLANNVIDHIYKSNERVFIIQDYMTIELAEYFAKLHFNGYLISDIRTKLDSAQDHPSDIDIVWNNALQATIIHILKPIYSMLKFHPPYFDKKDLDFKKYPFIIKDNQKALELTGVDFIEDYNNHQCTYFDGEIYLQPWQPAGSSEARLIVPRNYKMIIYNAIDWENKFYFYRYYRMYAYHNIDLSELSDEYDHCADCVIELSILSDYAKNDKKIINYLHNKINKFTFYGLMYNQKALYHGYIRELPKNINIYINTDSGIKKYSSDGTYKNYKGPLVAADNYLKYVDLQKYNKYETNNKQIRFIIKNQ